MPDEMSSGDLEGSAEDEGEDDKEESSGDEEDGEEGSQPADGDSEQMEGDMSGERGSRVQRASVVCPAKCPLEKCGHSVCPYTEGRSDAIENVRDVLKLESVQKRDPLCVHRVRSAVLILPSFNKEYFCPCMCACFRVYVRPRICVCECVCVYPCTHNHLCMGEHQSPRLHACLAHCCSVHQTPKRLRARLWPACMLAGSEGSEEDEESEEDEDDLTEAERRAMALDKFK
eukprot:1137150-Pelagomonas_calceolata.AAC.10